LFNNPVALKGFWVAPSEISKLAKISFPLLFSYKIKIINDKNIIIITYFI